MRVAARDLESLLKASPLSAGADWRLDAVSPLLDTGYFPDIDDIAGMAGVFFDEIERGGQVSLRDGEFVGRDGTRDHRAHLPAGQVHHRLPDRTGNGFPGLVSRGPAAVRPGRAAAARRCGGRWTSIWPANRDLVPVDMSGGAALRQITQRTNFIEQIRQGGPIVWPIFLIALAALVIVVIKIIYLNRMHGNTDRIMGEVNELAAKGDWAACEKHRRRAPGQELAGGPGDPGRARGAGRDPRDPGKRAAGGHPARTAAGPAGHRHAGGARARWRRCWGCWARSPA